ncbi:MAG TPA: glycosyltransferase family 39 protein [Bryobacteraceae bacterium]|nr:glycosyltransferase family 39 protein [Bryobacteraceae bacterium]
MISLLLLFGILYSLAIDSYGMFMWDEAEYASIGRSVLQGQGFSIAGEPNSLRPPFLPLAGAAAMWIFGGDSDDIILRGTEGVLALLALLCVYAFGAAHFDRTTGWVAAFLLGITPFFWTRVPMFLCEIPFLAFFAAAVWLFYSGLYLDQRYFLWSWIACALAFLTRHTAVLFFPILVLFVAIAWWQGGAEVRARILSRSFFLSPLAGVLVFLPWLAREQLAFGDPLAGLKKSAHQLQDYMPGVAMPWDFYIRRLPFLLSAEIALFVFVAIGWSLWKRHRFTLHNLLAAAFIVTWFSFYRYKEDRIVSSALPFLTMIAAAGLVKLTANLRPAVRGLVLGGLLAGSFALNFRVTRHVFENENTLGYPVFLDAMTFLREHATSGATVLGANFPQIFWYTGLHAINIPGERELPEALRKSQWMVISNFEPVQKPYVFPMLKLIPASPSNDSAVFSDKRCVTAVIRSEKMLQALK